MKFLSLLLALPGTLAYLAWPGSVHLSPRPQIETSPKHQALAHAKSTPRWKTCVVESGAVDDAPAILRAAKLCNYGGVVVFPKGKKYTIGTALDLTFLKHVDFDIQGFITFSDDVNYWNKNGFYLTFQNASTYWQFGGEDVNIYGGGTLDGNGQSVSLPHSSLIT
jgi:galacturan 1,4-alpha-galacturonidase